MRTQLPPILRLSSRSHSPSPPPSTPSSSPLSSLILTGAPVRAISCLPALLIDCLHRTSTHDSSCMQLQADRPVAVAPTHTQKTKLPPLLPSSLSRTKVNPSTTLVLARTHELPARSHDPKLHFNLLSPSHTQTPSAFDLPLLHSCIKAACPTGPSEPNLLLLSLDLLDPIHTHAACCCRHPPLLLPNRGQSLSLFHFLFPFLSLPLSL